MRYALFLIATCAAAQIPSGFKPLFNKKDLKGWHVSEVNHHGNTKAWKNENGVISVTQDKPGNGGILLTDKRYKNFEVYLEINPDFGCDGGLFLRSSEKGEAYQVLIDYLEGGAIGGIYGERLPAVNKPDAGTGKKIDREWQKYWKKGEWNSLRARITGDVPHITVWLNGTQIVDWTDSENHLVDGATDGMIALQTHRSDPAAKNSRWIPGGFHRYRNVAVKELP
jgi:hypothetical protein